MEYVNLKKEKQRRILNIKKLNRMKGHDIMNESIKNFIGKECIVTTMNASVTGVIDSAEESWITLSRSGKSDGSEIINIDYISRIQEHPRTRKGRKKVVIA